MRNLHDQGIAVYAGFVFGGDDELPDIFPRTFAFLLEANIESLHGTRLTPFPGTPLFRDFERPGVSSTTTGRTTISEPWCTSHST